MQAVRRVAVASLVICGVSSWAFASRPLPPRLIHHDELPQESLPYNPTPSAATFTVTIVDPGDEYAAYHDAIEAVTQAAANAWAACLDGTGTLELQVNFVYSDEDFIMRAGPILVETGETFNGFEVWQVGTIWELAGHPDPNGSGPDGDIDINTRFLTELYWDYPNGPAVNKLDAFDTLAHEIGHVLGFIHLEEFYTGEGPWASSFDINTQPAGTGHVFVGPSAVAAYLQPVPLADTLFSGDRSHVGISSGAGSLMYPYADYGQRHEITAIEIGILEDSGMPVLAACVPGSVEPSDPDDPTDPTDPEPAADADGDGVADEADNCPDVANADQADADGDDAGDLCDGCPDDFRKTAAGQCGCGVADIDADGDGVLNCLEECPFDPDKVEEGQCGCGRSDLDRDEDGTADCLDGCPLDPEKTAAGLAGCGNPEPSDEGDDDPADPADPTDPADPDERDDDFLTVDESPGVGCGAGSLGATATLSLSLFSALVSRRRVGGTGRPAR